MAPMQNLNGFVTFAAIVEAGSFSRASERLNISKGLASKQVVELERSLGVRLLNRNTRKIGLTAAGAVFYERCREIIAHAEGARHELEQFQSAQGGLVKVSAAISFGRLHLVPAIADFLGRHAGFRIELDLNEKFADLIAGGPDVVIRQAEEPRLNSLVARKLAPLRWVLCATPAYLATHPAPLAPEELGHHNCITYLSNTRGEWTFSLPGEPPQPVSVRGSYKASNADGVLQGVLSGIGVAAIPTFAAYSHLRSGQLVRLLSGYELGNSVLYAAYLPNPHMAQGVQTFVRFLIERFGPVPYWDEDGRADEA